MNYDDYMKFRGRCKELAEAEIAKDPTLTLVRGHYECPIWGLQQHWWTIRPDGTVFDPSARQFPSGGMGLYLPFDGTLSCANCGQDITEDDAWRLEGRYGYCSYTCYGQFVGVC
jgi:hypothetical protein